MTPEHERAIERLLIARAELSRFEQMMLGADSAADEAMLRRLRANVARALQDVAWNERIKETC